MAWVWWLLAPVASTGVGAGVIWWRTPAVAGRRLRRSDAVSEHQALLRALAQQPVARQTFAQQPIAQQPVGQQLPAQPSAAQQPAA